MQKITTAVVGMAMALWTGCGEDGKTEAPPSPTGTSSVTTATATDTDTVEDTAVVDTGAEIDHRKAAAGTYKGRFRIECSQGYILVVTDTCVGDLTVAISDDGAVISGSGTCAFEDFAAEFGEQELTIDGAIDDLGGAAGQARTAAFDASWFGSAYELDEDTGSYTRLSGAFFQAVAIDGYPTDCGGQWNLVRP